MIYEILRESGRELCLVTHPRARRGRGVLFATAPFTVYLLTVSVLFALAVGDLSLWSLVKQAAADGILLATVLALACFLLGRRVQDRIEVGPGEIAVVRTPALGPARRLTLPRAELTALAIDPSLRSLGADVLLVAVHRDGRRIPLAEGEPHSGQIHDVARRMAFILQIELEAPKFTNV